MRIKKQEMVLYIGNKLMPYGGLESLIISTSKKNLSRLKRVINAVFSERSDSARFKEKMRDIYAFLEKKADADGVIKLDYAELFEKEFDTILLYFSRPIPNDSEDVYWYPERADFFIKALQELHYFCSNQEEVLQDMNSSSSNDNLKIFKKWYRDNYEDDSFDDAEEDEELNFFDCVDWSDIDNPALYPEYVYD